MAGAVYFKKCWTDEIRLATTSSRVGAPRRQLQGLIGTLDAQCRWHRCRHGRRCGDADGSLVGRPARWHSFDRRGELRCSCARHPCDSRHRRVAGCSEGDADRSCGRPEGGMIRTSAGLVCPSREHLRKVPAIPSVQFAIEGCQQPRASARLYSRLRMGRNQDLRRKITGREKVIRGTRRRFGGNERDRCRTSS